MNIKSIEILGFKSFVDKVSLNFLPGITVLVGPNGCGKSNIVDAFRWAMGEQSAKQLRGRLMEDVIFNGSETRKPLGMAEVSITFSNERGDAPYEYSQYSEIMVTRRLFRSGESEYYINKIPCRLKDITELFLDTGVGTKSYSIIEQGKVEQLINSKPLERRTLIDEIAGISKYKSRKREALVKIESTKGNLLRVDDIIVEVKRQLNSLKRQANKLKRYQKIKEEIKEIELNSSLLHYASLKQKQNTIKEQLDQWNKDEIRLSTQTSSIEAAFEGEKVDLNEEEKLYHRTQEEIFKISSLCQKEGSSLEYLNREMLSVRGQHNQSLEQLKTIAERLGTQQNEIKILEQKNLAHNQTLKDSDLDLTQKEKQLLTLKEASLQLEGQIEFEKNKLIDLLTALTNFNNQLTQLAKNRHNLVLKIEHNKGGTEKQLTKLAHLEQAIADLKDNLKKTDTAARQAEEEKLTINSRIKTIVAELHQGEGALAEVKEQWEKSNSRLLSLQELQKNFEECDTGVRSIMLRDQNARKGQNGVCGLVVDFIETDLKYETALEAVLGEKLHYVIVESQLAGVEAIEYLKTQSSGRVSFIPLQIRNYQLNQLSPSIEKGKANPLLQFVKTKDEYKPIVEYLLGEVLLVDNLATALQLWNSNGIRNTLVTLEGEIIDSVGIITGGTQNGVHAKTLSKRREIKELNILLSEMRPKREHLQNQKQQLTSQLSQLNEDSGKLLEQIHQREISLLSLNRDLTQLTNESDETLQREELLKFEKEELLSTLSDLTTESSALQKERDINLATKNEKEVSLARLQEEAGNLNQQIDSMQNEITKLKVQVAAENERCENTTLNIQRMNKNLSMLREEHSQILQKIKDREQKQLSLENELQQTKVQIEKHLHTKQELERSLDKKREAIVQKEKNAKEKEELLKNIRRSLEEVRLKNTDLTVQITEINLTLTHLLKEIDEKYHLSLEDLLNTTPPEHISEDQDNAYQRLAELRTKIESLGEVNLAAVQEQEELANRYQFLSEQREDLTKSLESLNLAINKINRTTKQRFLEAYHTTNEQFQKVFPELFQGGKAELKMTDEDNILETGIEIVAQPPGKKLQTIDLLSGGEKTLTAIALLMAIFLVKPSPFCLLDEADSALDDTNATRFNQYMRNICHDSQFILITHNKLTMQAADTLYGITMEEPGISKTVSVQLQ